MDQLVQLVGAGIILGAYMSAQRGAMRFDSVQFLAMNTVGATVLAIVAALDRDYGFLLLEGVWAWVSARGLRKAMKEQKKEKKAQAKAKAGKSSGPFTRIPRTPRRKGKHNPLRKV
ncbi:MAG: CBU_0592 family membrane protein [Acidimicrobiia bacterium]